MDGVCTVTGGRGRGGQALGAGSSIAWALDAVARRSGRGRLQISVYLPYNAPRRFGYFYLHLLAPTSYARFIAALSSRVHTVHAVIYSASVRLGPLPHEYQRVMSPF